MFSIKAPSAWQSHALSPPSCYILMMPCPTVVSLWRSVHADVTYEESVTFNSSVNVLVIISGDCVKRVSDFSRLGGSTTSPGLPAPSRLVTRPCSDSASWRSSTSAVHLEGASRGDFKPTSLLRRDSSNSAEDCTSSSVALLKKLQVHQNNTLLCFFFGAFLKSRIEYINYYLYYWLVLTLFLLSLLLLLPLSSPFFLVPPKTVIQLRKIPREMKSYVKHASWHVTNTSRGYQVHCEQSAIKSA